MAGVTWYPVFRLTPQDGAVRVVDLPAELTYVGGPIETDLAHPLDQRARQDVNQVERPLNKGFRREVTLTFAIGDDMIDHELVTALVNALARPDIAVELSLDGGTTYAAVVLVSHRQEKLSGKWAAGVRYEIRVRAAELIDEVPSLASGRW